jgi:hypothetical protein
MPKGITGNKRIEMTELMSKSVKLADYDDDTQREYLVSLAHMYKDARVGDAQFKEICQGRAEPARDQNVFFSTCGELAMFLLERFGYRGKVLNRDLFDDSGKKVRAWRSGKNIEYLFMRGRKEGAFVEYLLSRRKDRRPQPGTIVYVGNEGKPNTEHVFLFDSDFVTEQGVEIWSSIDAGQGGRRDQHVAERVRVFDEKTGRLFDGRETARRQWERSGTGRRVIGWLDPVLLELTEKATLKLLRAVADAA